MGAAARLARLAMAPATRPSKVAGQQATSGGQFGFVYSPARAMCHTPMRALWLQYCVVLVFCGCKRMRFIRVLYSWGDEGKGREGSHPRSVCLTPRGCTSPWWLQAPTYARFALHRYNFIRVLCRWGDKGKGREGSHPCSVCLAPLQLHHRTRPNLVGSKVQSRLPYSPLGS